MHVAPVVASNKMPTLAPVVKRDLPGEERADEDRESSSGNAHDVVQQQQGGGCSKRPRTGGAAQEDTQAVVETGVDGGRKCADDMQSNPEASPAADAAEDVEVRLRVIDMRGEETEVVTRVGVDTVDLSAHMGLLALPEALRGLTAMRQLTVESEELETLPEWLGELRGLEVLRVTCENTDEGCPLEALPASLGALTGLTSLELTYCNTLTALPESLRALTRLTALSLQACGALMALPASLGALTRIHTLNLYQCQVLSAVPTSLGALTGPKTLNLSSCDALMALPASLGALTGLTELDLNNCDALHTPPSSIVRAGTGAVLQFLRDLAKGEAPSHLIKVVLLGDQRAGKSSLADSLVLGRPATRADNDRTVGIEVRRWRLGGQSQLVANIFDAAGQRVYRATHGFFISPGALFLHVVRCDMPEDAAVMALLEWVQAVQQEAPADVMGLVWTHTDLFADGVCGGADSQLGRLRVVGSEGGETTSWIAMRYIQQLVGAPCALKDVGIVNCRRHQFDHDATWCFPHRHVETEDVRGMVTLDDDSKNIADVEERAHYIKAHVLDVQSRGAVGVLVIHYILYDYDCETRLDKLCSSLCTAADIIIPIMFISDSDAGAFASPDAKVTAFAGWLLPCYHAMCLYLLSSCA